MTVPEPLGKLHVAGVRVDVNVNEAGSVTVIVLVIEHKLASFIVTV